MFRSDLVAGLTVAVMIIPQGMAYALLAGLPAIYGLYAAFVPLLIYPFFGSSRQLSVGPVALVSIIVLASISEWAPPGSDRFIQLAILTSMVAGIIQVVLSLLKMGFLVNFLSEPVIAGFTAAAALIIALSQFKYLLGIEIARSTTILSLLKHIGANITETHLVTFGIGASALALIFILKKWNPKIPGALIAVILGTIVAYFLHLDTHGVDIVSEVPAGLPSFGTNFISIQDVGMVIPLAFVICLISFIESLAIAKTIAARHDNYPIDANKELFGLGMAKIVGSFFQAFPNTGSFTRSAINDEAGANSGLSSIFSGLVIGIILLFLTPLFYYLPKPVLAAVVISAVFGLIKISYVRNLYALNRNDFYVFLVTFLLTLLLGVQDGVFTGIILSLAMVMYESSRPHYAVLGQLPGTPSFRNIERYPDAITFPDKLIIRYDENLYFGNAEHFIKTLNDELAKRPDTRAIILNASAITLIDSTALEKLGHLIDNLHKRNIDLIFTNLRGPTRDLFDKSGITKQIGRDNNYLTIQDAVEGHLSSNGEKDLSRKYAAQKNIAVKKGFKLKIK